MDNEAKYIVEFQEYDSTPWRIDGLFTKRNAWKRIKMCAANIVPGWPYPVWARVYIMRDVVACADCGAIQDEWQLEHDNYCRCGGAFRDTQTETCVYSQSLT